MGDKQAERQLQQKVEGGQPHGDMQYSLVFRKMEDSHKIAM
jgi:hypothetical protein